MEFKVNGDIASNGDVVNSRGGTEQMKAGLIDRLSSRSPHLLEEFNIICSRVRELDPDKKNILWLHDLPGDPESNHMKHPPSRERFAKLVFVSNWQFAGYNRLYGVRYNESAVLRNAIVPFRLEDTKKDPSGPIRLIYHTTPHRGLEILVPVFEALYNKFGDGIHLDVFSSFNIYGWPQRDEPYEKLFETCRNHPGIEYHGAVDNEIVREYLMKAHIFAYPSIWQETSCMSMVEAMSAGCCVVAPDYAAIPETGGNFPLTYRFDEDINVHANRFAGVLNGAIESCRDDVVARRNEFQKVWTDNFYSWDHRIFEWEALLNSLRE